MNERKLLARIAAEDQVALKQLYDLYYPRIGRFLYRITSDRELLAEVINDVFYVVWTKAGAFRGDSSPSTWILGIAYKKALKSLSRQRSFEPLDALDQQPAEDLRNRHSEIQASLARLSAKHQAVIVLSYEFGYSYREIGQILDCPENTVKTRMFHARKALRALLEA